MDLFAVGLVHHDFRQERHKLCRGMALRGFVQHLAGFGVEGHIPGEPQDGPWGSDRQLAAWGGALKEWAEFLLDEKRLPEQGIINPDPIRTKWSEYISGTCMWHYYLWNVLMFQAWLDHAQQDLSYFG